MKPVTCVVGVAVLATAITSFRSAKAFALRTEAAARLPPQDPDGAPKPDLLRQRCYGDHLGRAGNVLLAFGVEP